MGAFLLLAGSRWRRLLIGLGLFFLFVIELHEISERPHGLLALFHGFGKRFDLFGFRRRSFDRGRMMRTAAAMALIAAAAKAARGPIAFWSRSNACGLWTA